MPRVPGTSRRGGWAGAAGQAAGPRAGFGDPRAPDGGGRAGLPARGQRARHRAAVGRAGAGARRPAAVPGAGEPLPYLGHTVPFGAHLRYLVFASRPQRVVVGCLQFSSPAWRMAARDGWVDWDDATRGRNLQHVVNNSRFLLLPWVGVRNLASAVLSRGLAHLRVDWPRRYGLEPWLVETLVDRSRHHGGFVSRRQLGRVGGHHRSRADGPLRPPSRRGAQDGSRLSSGPGREAAAAGGLSDASGSPPRRGIRPGAVCGGGDGVCGGQGLFSLRARPGR